MFIRIFKNQNSMNLELTNKWVAVESGNNLSQAGAGTWADLATASKDTQHLQLLTAKLL